MRPRLEADFPYCAGTRPSLEVALALVDSEAARVEAGHAATLHRLGGALLNEWEREPPALGSKGPHLTSPACRRERGPPYRIPSPLAMRGAAHATTNAGPAPSPVSTGEGRGEGVRAPSQAVAEPPALPAWLDHLPADARAYAARLPAHELSPWLERVGRFYELLPDTS